MTEVQLTYIGTGTKLHIVNGSSTRTMCGRRAPFGKFATGTPQPVSKATCQRCLDAHDTHESSQTPGETSVPVECDSEPEVKVRFVPVALPGYPLPDGEAHATVSEENIGVSNHVGKL